VEHLFRRTCGSGNLEVVVLAPPGSTAGHLIVFTNGEDLWLRYSPPYMCYMVHDENEMLSIIDQLLQDQALFVVIMRGDVWEGTTLINRQQKPDLKPAQSAQICSWSGTHDRIVKEK
jgi:hypothetical protein